MTPERYEQIGQICDAALELEPGERAAFIERACGQDEELRQEIESLLEAHEQAGDFIANPALGSASELLGDFEAAPLPAGHAVGHYRVLSLLGAGGMGEVYLAEDTSLGRKVALKLLLKEFTDDPERVRRFELEARAASALNHPNILTIHEIGRAGNVYYIATEFIEGETLRDQMAKARMPLADAIDVAAQVAGALEVAHAEGVVHRDIKPDNIMVRRRDRIVKVLHFGLTKLTEKAAPATRGASVGSAAPSSLTNETEPGLVMGTVRYMSPEQTRGSALVDHRTDIWSLGVVIYEMVAGRAPFEGEDIHRRIISIQEDEPPPLAAYAEGVPERIEEIVRKALAKEPAERYQTASDLLDDLRDLKRRLEVGEELARPPSPGWAFPGVAVRSNSGQAFAANGRPSTAGKGAAPAISSAEVIAGEIRRHKRGFLFTLAVFTLLAAGGAFGVYRWLGRDRPANRASAPVPKVVPVTSFPGTELDPSFSPDGRQIAFDSTAEGHRDIYVVGAGGGRPRRLTTEASADVRPSWSRDGRFVYFGSDRGGGWQVWKAPAEGGPAVQVTKQGGREAFESPDGRFVCYAKENVPGLWRMPAEGGEAAQVLGQVRQGAWAVWEQGVYFLDPDARPSLSVESYSFAAGGTTRVTTIEKELFWSGPGITAAPDGRWILYAQNDQTESDIMLVEDFL
jgi:serine/threonine protein kinase